VITPQGRRLVMLRVDAVPSKNDGLMEPSEMS